MTNPVPTSADEFVEQQLNARLSLLEESFDFDALCIVGPLVYQVDDLARTMIEELQTKAEKRSRLVVILTTNGGHLQPVHRIVDTIRQYYDHVIFIIPNYVFSAETVLAMSGDEIYMDYYSRLNASTRQHHRWLGQPAQERTVLNQRSDNRAVSLPGGSI